MLTRAELDAITGRWYRMEACHGEPICEQAVCDIADLTAEIIELWNERYVEKGYRLEDMPNYNPASPDIDPASAENGKE